MKTLSIAATILLCLAGCHSKTKESQTVITYSPQGRAYIGLTSDADWIGVTVLKWEPNYWINAWLGTNKDGYPAAMAWRSAGNSNIVFYVFQLDSNSFWEDSYFGTNHNGRDTRFLKETDWYKTNVLPLKRGYP